MVRVVLPQHLRNHADVRGEVLLEVVAPVCVAAILQELETLKPVLRGTIRDHVTLKRRPFIRFFACGRDISLEPDDCELPEAIAKGDQPFMVVGAIAGG